MVFLWCLLKNDQVQVFEVSDWMELEQAEEEHHHEVIENDIQT